LSRDRVNKSTDLGKQTRSHAGSSPTSASGYDAVIELEANR
jgi:hypothetical protein